MQPQINQQPTNQKKWYSTPKGIVVIILAVLFGIPILATVINPASNSNTTAPPISEEQKTQAILDARQAVIDKYHQPYCVSHTKMKMRADPKLTDAGWPTFSGTRDWTIEECKLIITRLYDTGTKESRIASISEGRKIGVGLSNLELIYSIGYPDDVNTTTTASGTREQWIYGDPLYDANYVYLDNGVVTSYQQ